MYNNFYFYILQNAFHSERTEMVWGCTVLYVPSSIHETAIRGSLIRNTIIPQGQMYRVKVNRGVLGDKEM